MKSTINAPDSTMLEKINCYHCGSNEHDHFINAWEDLTGKPGMFSFVKCQKCELVYQNPRIKMEYIGKYYDDEYIAHRKKQDWGCLTPLYNYAMDKHDRQKSKLVEKYIKLSNNSRVIDVGCGAGTFLQKINLRYGANATGVDFKDLSHLPAYDLIDFKNGLFYEQTLEPETFDLVTMWHFLEHDYDPEKTLNKAKNIMHKDSRMIIEVPRLDSLTFQLYKERWPGLQAPQHTVLYDKSSLLRTIEKAGFEIVDYLPYGAFPAYFYIFSGLVFKFLKGKGLNLSKAIYPYFAGQLILSPILFLEKHLNLAMQTVVCKKVE